jgi:hypothetical protein
MRRVAQSPAHYEVELRQPTPGDGRTDMWRAIRRVGPDGTMAPLKFASLRSAQAYAGRVNPVQARVVAVEHGGGRRTVDAAET